MFLFDRLLPLGPLTLVALPVLPAAAQTCTTTISPGSVAPNSTWTLAGSPYCVTGDITVSLLEIDPGVQVLIDGPYSITVTTTLEVNGTAAQPVVFRSKDPSLRWSGFRFSNTPPGSHFHGAVIERTIGSAVRFVNAALPPFVDCVLRDNTSVNHGGALDVQSGLGNLVLERCRFEHNTAPNHGGGARIRLESGSKLLATDCVWTTNVTNPTFLPGDFAGGAVFFEQGDAVLTNCTFRGNRVQSQCTSSGTCDVAGRGGALYFAGGGTLTVEGSEFIENVVEARNLGICSSGGTTTARGGSIYLASGTLDLRNSVTSCEVLVASGNGCGPQTSGSGLYLESGAAHLTHCTVARNSFGSGLEQASGSLTVLNSIVYGNNAGGPQIGGTATVDYSCIEGGHSGTGNTPFDPAFAGVGCNHHQLSVLLGSPALDSGEPQGPADACFPPSFYGGVNERPDMGHNGGPLACHWYGQALTSTPASPAFTSVGSGGSQLLQLNPGAEYQGDFYFVLGSVSGFAPGFPLDSLHIPLQPADPYFDLTAAGSTAIPLTGGFGTLGPVGAVPQATAQFTIPAGVYPPVLSGVRVYHSFLVIRVTPTLIELVFASNPVEAWL